MKTHRRNHIRLAAATVSVGAVLAAGTGVAFGDAGVDGDSSVAESSAAAKDSDADDSATNPIVSNSVESEGRAGESDDSANPPGVEATSTSESHIESPSEPEPVAVQPEPTSVADATETASAVESPTAEESVDEEPSPSAAMTTSPETTGSEPLATEPVPERRSAAKSSVDDEPAELATADTELDTQPVATTEVSAPAAFATSAFVAAETASEPADVDTFPRPALALFTLVGLPFTSPYAPATPAPPVSLNAAMEAYASRRFTLAGLFSTFFNKTPTMTPVVNEQTETGIITGYLDGRDADQDRLVYTVTGQPAHGTVVVDQDGNFTYTPNAEIAANGGTDSFTVKASDTTNPHLHLGAALNNLIGSFFGVPPTDPHTATTTVSLNVNPVDTNRPPVNTGEPVGVSDPDPTTGAVTITSPITDPDGDTLTYTVEPAGSGTVTPGTGNTFTYTPSDEARHDAAVPGAPQTQDVTFTATDSEGESESFTVTIPIAPKNDAPTVSTTTVDEIDPSTGQATGTINGTDADGDELHYTPPVGGTTDKGGVVTINDDGSFTYTPTPEARWAAGDPNATEADKTDTFTVVIDDGHGGTTPVIVTVEISPTDTLVVTKATGASTAVKSADGSTQVFSKSDSTAQTTTVTTLNTADGTSFVTTLSGIYQSSKVSADGRTALVVTRAADGARSVTTIDTATGVSHTTPVYGGVNDTLLSADGAYALVNTITGSGTSGDPFIHHVMIIDTATGTNSGTNTLPGFVWRNQISEDGSIAAVGNGVTGANYLTLIDSATGMTQDIPLNGAAHDVRISKDARTVIATTYTSADGGITYLTLVDLDTGRRTTLVEGTPVLVQPQYDADGTSALVITRTSPTTYFATTIDGTTGKTHTAALPGVYYSSRVMSDGTSAVVLSKTSDSTYVTVIDMEAGTSETITVPGGFFNGAVSGDGSTTATTTSSSVTSTVTIIDNATGAVRTVNVSGAAGPVRLSADGQTAIVTTMTSNPSGNAVTTIDTASGTTHTAPLPGTFYSSELSDDGTSAVIVTRTAGGYTATVVDTSTGASHDVPLSGIPMETRFSSDSGTVFFTTVSESSLANHVTSVDVATGASSTTEIPGTWMSSQYNEDGTTVVVTSRSGSSNPANPYTWYLTRIDGVSATTHSEV